MDIKVLGSGCEKCKMLEKKVRDVVERNNINAKIEKVTDINEIISYNILMTPGLVINGKVVSAGKLPDEKQIMNWIEAASK